MATTCFNIRTIRCTLLKSILVTMMFLVTIDCSVYIADFTMSRMIELLSRPPYCRLHTDRGDIQRMLLAADPKKTRLVPRESVLALENVCSEADGTSTEIQGGLGFIYPGTKWCGPGNISTSYDDVGRYADEDRCCREHDNCPNFLEPGECRRGLCNRGSVVRSHCDCDARFRRCLQNIQTETANTLGAAFFNVIQVTCFRERRPCSVWQRSSCLLEFVPADFYKLYSKDGKIYDGQTHDDDDYDTDNHIGDLKSSPSQRRNSYQRSYDPSTIEISNIMSPSNARSRLQQKSVELVVKNILHEVVLRPVQGFFKVIKTVEDIWVNNGNTTELLRRKKNVKKTRSAI